MFHTTISMHETGGAPAPGLPVYSPARAGALLARPHTHGHSPATSKHAQGKPGMGEQACVHVVDDDDSLRRSLHSLFRSVDLAVHAYGSAQEFFDAERAEVPSCLVLDVRLPGISGLDLQQQLHQSGIRIPVVLMTGHGDIAMSVRGMKAGAIDFLTKPFRDQEMLDAVLQAIAKDRERLVTEKSQSEVRRKFETLSPRERQVMSLVTAGRLNKQVAGDLNLSEITVKVHRGSAMRKMGARTLADLVRMAELLELKPEPELPQRR